MPLLDGVRQGDFNQVIFKLNFWSMPKLGVINSQNLPNRFIVRDINIRKNSTKKL